MHAVKTSLFIFIFTLRLFLLFMKSSELINLTIYARPTYMNGLLNFQIKYTKKLEEKLPIHLMLRPKDQNASSAPNFLQVSKKRNSDSIHNKDQRKPILKKNAGHHINDETNQHEQKENIPGLSSKLSMSAVNDSKSVTSSEFARRNQHKKKSIFLELDELHNSDRKKNRSNSKKISFRSVGTDESKDINYHSNYKQSKVDIIFSNSNISDSFYILGQENSDIDFDLPQKSYQNLKSSEIVQNKLLLQPSIKLNFKKISKYQDKKSDRIIEQSEQNRYPKKLQKPKLNDKTLTTNGGPLSTAQSNFRQTEYYEQDFSIDDSGDIHFLKIKQSPPVQSQKTSLQLANMKKTLSGSKSSIKLGKTDQQQIYLNRIQEARKRLLQSLQSNAHNQEDDLLSTFNPYSSKLLSKSDQLKDSINFQNDFKEQTFQKVNLYRFLNRLCYKVNQYLNFKTNRKVLDQLISGLTKVKCFILLNTEIQLKSSSARSNKENISQSYKFLQIFQGYIEKERTQPYWENVEIQFLKTSRFEFSLRNQTLKFLESTIPEIESQLLPVKYDLQRNIRSKQTLMLQLRFKLLKYLFYDVYKLNFVGNQALPITCRNTDNKKKRLIEIIEKNQWDQKIPFNKIQLQFEQLKMDFYQSY